MYATSCVCVSLVVLNFASAWLFKLRSGCSSVKCGYFRDAKPVALIPDDAVVRDDSLFRKVLEVLQLVIVAASRTRVAALPDLDCEANCKV